MAKSAQSYCEAYDRYHITFASSRLGGWNGNFDTAPTELLQSHARMVEAFEQLYAETMDQPRPNYADVVQELQANG